jgi:hypothetical protein
VIYLVTGNDLRTGAVLWWAGQKWSHHLADAKPLSAEEGEALRSATLAKAQINDVAVIEAEITEAGPRPLHIRERVRAIGPSVRMDLAQDAPCTFTATRG